MPHRCRKQVDASPHHDDTQTVQPQNQQAELLWSLSVWGCAWCRWRWPCADQASDHPSVMGWSARCPHYWTGSAHGWWTHCKWCTWFLWCTGTAVNHTKQKRVLTFIHGLNTCTVQGWVNAGKHFCSGSQTSGVSPGNKQSMEDHFPFRSLNFNKNILSMFRLLIHNSTARKILAYFPLKDISMHRSTIYSITIWNTNTSNCSTDSASIFNISPYINLPLFKLPLEVPSLYGASVLPCSWSATPFFPQPSSCWKPGW